MNDKITENQIKRLFPHVSASTLARNSYDPSAGKPSKLESIVRITPNAARATAKKDPRKFFIRITDVRKRLLDEDNLAAKATVDCLRYADIIPGDSPSQTRIQTTQRRIQEGERPHTLIEIFEIIEPQPKTP